MTSDVLLIPADTLDRSGVEILAQRWTLALRHDGVAAQLVVPDARGGGVSHVHAGLRAASLRSATVVVLGLPSPAEFAQEVVDAIRDHDGRVILLWERSAHSMENSAAGLVRLEAIREAWLLNEFARGSAQSILPSARIDVVSLAIPDVFFRAKHEAVTPYAAYLGRFSESKGAAVLARAWVDEVFPVAGLPLVMAGRGMSGGSTAETEILEAEEQFPQAIRTVHLMAEESRARFLGSADLVIFPARTDYFPQALAEALAAGAPIAATDITGHRPLARPGETSFALDLSMSNLGCIVELAAADDSSIRQLAVNGRCLAKSTQSAEATSRRLVDLLS
ncbi:glycosyltransferase [Leifsonia sp. LS-T14]|uniref:glycosyltransferase n=1 Tax=unclassified Leifsonia TaxID=2663824 RepID=UPI0035A6FFC7